MEAFVISPANIASLIIAISFAAFNIDDGTFRVKDAWTGKSLGKLKSIPNLTLEPHACILSLLKR